MKLIKKLGVSLWWSCIAGLVGMLVAAVLIFGPDIFPTPAPPPDLQREIVKVMRGGMVHAQGRDNVYQLALNAVTVATNSGILRNNGQSQHYLWAQMTGGACAYATSPVSDIELGMQGSYDNLTWFNIGSGLTNLFNGNGVSIASGAFPFLRARLAATYANCTTSVWYTGAIAPTPDVLASWAYRAIEASGTGPVSNGNFIPAVPGRVIAVYGFQAQLIAGAGPVTVFARGTANTNCTGAVVGNFNYTVLATATPFLVLPNSTVPYYFGPPGTPICFDLSAGGTVTLRATIRYE